MKLAKLDSTTQRISADAQARAQLAARELVLRVEGMEALEGDKQRSLQQELACIDPKAVGEYHGQTRVADSVHDLAQALTALGDASSHLINTTRLQQQGIELHALDEEA